MEATAAASDPLFNLESAFLEHKRFLWNLLYRLTGDAADAEDLIQETFIRALKHPPPDQSRNWRPWLVQVALNLGRDVLRRRKRSGYTGSWLPSPVETEPPSYEPEDHTGNPAARYDMIESVSYAFLLALEVLSPMQRAVLVLRDVFDYSAAEAAEALGSTEANARKLHSRARRALAGYEAVRCPFGPERQDRTRKALERFLQYLATADAEGMRSLLAPNAKVSSDGGGEFFANTVPVAGADRVIALLLGLSKKSPAPSRIEWKVMNGLPALLVERPPESGFSPRFVLQVDTNQEGKLTEFYSVLSTRKLAAI